VVRVVDVQDYCRCSADLAFAFMFLPRPGKRSLTSEGDDSSVLVISMKLRNMSITITRSGSVNGSHRLVDEDSTRAPRLVHNYSPAFMRPAADGPQFPQGPCMCSLTHTVG
jgi:hypothetical protein